MGGLVLGLIWGVRGGRCLLGRGCVLSAIGVGWRVFLVGRWVGVELSWWVGELLGVDFGVWWFGFGGCVGRG